MIVIYSLMFTEVIQFVGLPSARQTDGLIINLPGWKKTMVKKVSLTFQHQNHNWIICMHKEIKWRVHKQDAVLSN